MVITSQNSFQARKNLDLDGKGYVYFDLHRATDQLNRLPFSHRILLEMLLRHEDGQQVTAEDIGKFVSSALQGKPQGEVAFYPARVLMQDFTGVPAIVDLAAMRDAMAKLGQDPSKINPLIPVDLVIDHSVIVENYGNPNALNDNVSIEYKRNLERYQFLRWGQKAFKNFRVVPPGTGICHQVNLEYLAQVIWTQETDTGETVAYPDTLVGTDSHTTMVNGLSVLGWGVGGIEAEAAMLGQSLSMVAPEVIGFKLTGHLPEGTTATDLVLTITNILRTKGVVGKFVEYFGPGLENLTLEDRATIANMAPEYGATCGFFPIDQKTIDYLRFSGRDPHRVALVETYAKAQGLWYNADEPEPVYSEVLSLDLGTILPTLAGPKRPQDKVLLSDIKALSLKMIQDQRQSTTPTSYAVPGESYELTDGDIVIAAITSCTNTSNPSVLIAAGLLARKARAYGLKPRPWVKTSLAPGSQVVTDYLNHAGLMEDLEALGFNLVGYGCTTCIGNSGPLKPAISKVIEEKDLLSAAVLSGNRNFEARVHPLVKANYLASPPLVVAYALAGSMNIDLTKDPLGQTPQGQPVYLKDIWPTSFEIQQAMLENLTPEMFRSRYSDVFKGDTHWQSLQIPDHQTYAWDANSTYVKNPPYFSGINLSPQKIQDIEKAHILALLGDSITTDHISPAGNIKIESPAGHYLRERNVVPDNFNSYGARRGNHEIMMRGTFANIRIQNEMTPEKTGGYTRFVPTQDIMAIYDAAMAYQKAGHSLVIFAGKEYGTGSSRDWAAKGTNLLGVRAVIAESFERIHRSNLVGMGILPLEFPEGQNRKTLNLTGEERISIQGIESSLTPKSTIMVNIERQNGEILNIPCRSRIDTQDDVEAFRHGGILPYVLRMLAC